MREVASPSLATTEFLEERAELREHELESDRNKVLAFQHSHTILMLIPTLPMSPIHTDNTQFASCVEPHTKTPTPTQKLVDNTPHKNYNALVQPDC